MAARQGPPGSLAARVTYLLEPKNWLIVTVVGVGAHADGLAGAGWGLLAAFFAAVLPTVFRDHTTPQVVSGSVLGAAAAFLAYAAIVA